MPRRPLDYSSNLPLKAIYTVFTSPHHAPMPNHLPTLIVTPHGQPNQVLYTYLHTEENRVNYLLTPSPQGDLSSLPTMPNHKHNTVRCEASRDLRWTIENTGVQHPTYKIVNQDDTPLYQISKPNPHADWWTMFYFKYAGHQIPPRRVEFGKISKNPPEKGGGTRITITGKGEDEKQVWQTLGVGNEDCVEWVVCCAALNLLDDQILLAAERKQTGAGPASTAPSPAMAPSPAATPARPEMRRQGSLPNQPGRMGPGIASTGAGVASTGQQFRGPSPQQSMGPQGGRPPMGMPPPGQGGPQQGRPPMQMGRPPMQMQQPPMQMQQQQPPQGYNPHMRPPPNMGHPGMQRGPSPQQAQPNGRRF